MKSTILMVLVFEAVLCLALAAPLAAGKIKPNSLYGVRTQATMKDEQLWFRVNREFAYALGATGVVMGLAVILDVTGVLGMAVWGVIVVSMLPVIPAVFAAIRVGLLS